MTVHVAPQRADLDPDADPAPPPLLHLAGVRVAVVLWGGLAVVDVWGPTGTPPYVALGAVALLTMLSTLGTRTGTAICAAAVAWLVVDGFVVHQAGVLAWGGMPDVARLALLIALAVLPTRVHR